MIIELLVEQREHLADMYDRFKGTPLVLDQADAAIIKMYREGFINATKISDLMQAYEQPPHDWGSPTA